MSWIKIGDGRFRSPIPRLAKNRLSKKTVEKLKKPNDDDTNQYLLRKGNIPREVVWNEQKNACASSNISLTELDRMIEDEFWTRKETSCDIELDTNGRSVDCSTVFVLVSDLLTPVINKMTFNSYEYLEC